MTKRILKIEWERLLVEFRTVAAILRRSCAKRWELLANDLQNFVTFQVLSNDFLAGRNFHLRSAFDVVDTFVVGSDHL
jgi:hypothetical protein